MNATLLFPVSGLITAVCAWLLWMGVWGKPRIGARGLTLTLAFSMLLSMFALIRMEPITNWGLDFRLGASVALCTLIVQYIYVIGLLRHGIHGLGLFLLPATAVPLMIIPVLPDEPILRVQASSLLETGHLMLSLTAYAVLTLAALHAIMHLLLDRALKRKQIGPIVQALPSLMEIENHMYGQVRAAAWLLALGILTGLVWQWEAAGGFLLSHKVILSLFAWAVLMTLMAMRRRAGWQGGRASWMVIAAYVLLLLAYFGVRVIQSWLGVTPAPGA